MQNKNLNLEVQRLGECRVPSPMSGVQFVGEDDRVLYHTDPQKIELFFKAGQKPPAFELAGPRNNIYFDPSKLKCGIVTCGGLCPGLNDVIRAIVMGLHYHYGVKTVFGFPYGYEGLSYKYSHAPIELTPDVVNDISYIDQSFGFVTAVSESRTAIYSAHTEAQGARNGIGLVKLMGRESGFIAAYASITNGDVNFCLIPEMHFSLDAFFEALQERLEKRKHAVVVVGEGAGQDLMETSGQRDSSGNIRFGDIGLFLKDRILAFFRNKGMDVTLKYINPSYTIRSMPANPHDSGFCLLLGHNAVHAGMCGKTNMVVGHWNNRFTHVPIPLAVSKRKQIDPHSRLWGNVLSCTGQPKQIRVVARKGIEMAIELVSRLDKKAKLVISHASGDEGYDYQNRLKEYSEFLKVDTIFVDDIIKEQRGSTEDGRKIYTLSDVYPHCDLVTYPSTFEGFGNAFMEAVYFHKPIVVNKYSIYLKDIKPKGFRAVELDGYVTSTAVKQTKEILEDIKLCQEILNHNYEIGKRFFSYSVLRRLLKGYIAEHMVLKN